MKTNTPSTNPPALRRLWQHFQDWTEKSSGPRNLVCLAIFCLVVTFATVSISLKLYHDSGDIYLDRSRPGFLPEEEEVEEDEDSVKDYVFPDSGPLTESDLADFLENLKAELNRLNDFSSDPFSPDPLSSATLGF